ncbi:alpha/beta hydrolase [Kribbella sp. NPDC051952]|uniref:alpha/beta fold hydrolase n=1 Tax=Kribbella sp. NPDC051952 TaxID=3154851 RepID=UPI00341D4714
MTFGKLSMPGATLHYEVTGAGPVLLLICGGKTDAAIFGGIAGQLAAGYTVVSYDPRGNSRSAYDGVPDDGPGPGAAEALALLEEVAGDEPAYVFGSSSGAIAGLELITRHPERVRRLVAHEPPCVEVLPDAVAAGAFFADVEATYRADGPEAAEAKFIHGIGADQGEPPRLENVPPAMLEMFLRMQANTPVFYEHKLLPFTRYAPDLEALAASAAKIVPAVGVTSAGFLPGRPIQVIAERIGRPVVRFPGDHVGYAADPVGFAGVLAEVLAAD